MVVTVIILMLTSDWAILVVLLHDTSDFNNSTIASVLC